MKSYFGSCFELPHRRGSKTIDSSQGEGGVDDDKGASVTCSDGTRKWSTGENHRDGKLLTRAVYICPSWQGRQEAGVAGVLVCGCEAVLFTHTSADQKVESWQELEPGCKL